MVRRIAVALGSWLLATTVATAATLVGVSLVTTGFVSHPPLTVPDRPGEPAAPARPVPVRGAAASSRRVTFASDGGLVTASCAADGVHLESATPHPGHRVVVGSAGPRRIEVSFSRGTATEETRVACEGGEPVRVGSEERPAEATDQAASAGRGPDEGNDVRVSTPGPPGRAADRTRPGDRPSRGGEHTAPDERGHEPAWPDRPGDGNASDGDPRPPTDPDAPFDGSDGEGWEGTDGGSPDDGGHASDGYGDPACGADEEEDPYRTDGGSYGGDSTGGEGGFWYGDGCPPPSDATWSDGPTGASRP